MSQARETILARLRQNAAQATASPEPEGTTREAAWQARQPPIGDLTEAFIRGQEAVGGRVIRVPDWDAMPEAVLPWMAEHPVRSVMTGTVARLEPLRARLREAGIAVRTYDAPMETHEAALFETDCGITTSAGGLADTGSVILWPTPEEPRLLSLAMPVHLVLVERARLFPHLLVYLESGEYAADPPSNWFLATGASRTADIEQTLTIGVHGPKVFLVALIG